MPPAGAAWWRSQGEKARSSRSCSVPSGGGPVGFVAVWPRSQGPGAGSLWLPSYSESWSSLAFCRIWQMSLMG